MAIYSFQQLVLFSLMLITITASFDHLDHHLSYTIRDDVCTNADCGHGTCVADLGGLLFHCDCDPGWKAIQMGPMTYPSCSVPNCTLNFTCGNGAPPPPSPPIPPLNFTSPCNLVWCGDGNCVVNGTGHYCQCYDGSANLLDNPVLICMKQCYYGADCHRTNIGPNPPPAAPSTSASAAKGTNEAWNRSWRTRALSKLVIAVLTATSILTM